MCIENKTWLGWGRRAQCHGYDTGGRCGSGVYRDPVAILYQVSEVNRAVASDDRCDFGMRRAERLDHFFDRHTPLEAVDELRVPPRGRQEVVQLGVEMKSSLAHT